MFGSVSEALSSGVLREPVDFDSAHRRLEALREDCLEWIRRSLVR
jgi:hypothetical protein